MVFENLFFLRIKLYILLKEKNLFLKKQYMLLKIVMVLKKIAKKTENYLAIFCVKAVPSKDRFLGHFATLRKSPLIASFLSHFAVKFIINGTVITQAGRLGSWLLRAVVILF